MLASALAAPTGWWTLIAEAGEDGVEVNIQEQQRREDPDCALVTQQLRVEGVTLHVAVTRVCRLEGSRASWGRCDAQVEIAGVVTGSRVRSPETAVIGQVTHLRTGASRGTCSVSLPALSGRLVEAGGQLRLESSDTTLIFAPAEPLDAAAAVKAFEGR